MIKNTNTRKVRSSLCFFPHAEEMNKVQNANGDQSIMIAKLKITVANNIKQSE